MWTKRTTAVHMYRMTLSPCCTVPEITSNTTAVIGNNNKLNGLHRVLLIWHTMSLHWKRNSKSMLGADIEQDVSTGTERHPLLELHNSFISTMRTVNTHSNVGERCAHHEIKDSGLLLDDVCGRETDPKCWQYKQEGRREKRQQGLVYRTVLQGVITVRPETKTETKWELHIYNNKAVKYIF